MRYLVTLVYDPEYRGFVADVPSLPGCMSQGKTVEKALENVREAIQLYLEDNDSEIQPSKYAPITTEVEV